MAEVKRGMAMLVTSGDPEISNALADGILTARALLPVQVETEEAALIRKKVADALRRIDMRKNRGDDGDDDIETRILRARANYSTPQREPSMIRSIGEKLLGWYGLAVLKLHGFFDFDNARWRG